MKETKAPSTLIVGLALFSMFFGSGNLTFPLKLGSTYESYFWLSALGFIITAALLPTLGILAMIPAHGRYERLFAELLSNKLSKWFFLIVLIFWIPLGSGPRCVVLAHASIDNYIDIMPPLWLFSIIFLAITYACVVKQQKIITILGKFLTPALLLIILGIVVASFRIGDIDPSAFDPANVFFTSLKDGYYTQDLIAAVFFSSSLVSMLKSSGSEKQALKKTWLGGIIAIILLTIIYTALMAASAVHSEYLQGLSGERLISTLARIALGPTFGAISSVGVSLACLTTEIALVVVFADFINRSFFHNKYRKRSLFITLGIIYAMAQLKFQGIMAVVEPSMKIIYPVLFFLVVRFLWRSRNTLME